MPLWILYALISAIAAAAVALFGKIGIAKIDSTLATTVRAIVMALFFVVISGTLGKFKLLHTISTKAFSFIVLAGIAGTVSWFFYFLALKIGPASGVAALDRLSLVFVIVLAALFLGESLTLKVGVGTLFMILGAVLITLR